MTALLIAVAVAGWVDDPARAGAPATPRYEAFAREFEAAQTAWDERFSPGGKPTPDDQWVPRYRDWPGWSFLPRGAAIAGGKADDPEAVAAFFWVSRQVQSVGLDDDAIYPIVADLLGRFSAADLARSDGGERLRDAFRYTLRRPSPATEAFLARTLAESTDRATRGRAALALGRLLASKAKVRRAPWYERPDRTPFEAYIDSRIDRRLKDYIRACDPAQAQAAAVAALRRAIDEFGDVAYAPPTKGKEITVAEVAESELNELQHLQVGMVAPAIDGTDVAGKPLRLADYRGKVVVLSFWGSWCGPCMAMVPHERALVERMKDRPFALLGINGGDAPETARAVMAREGMTWPSWSDGGEVGGPIADRWNVGAWPTLCVLDAEGRIRFRGQGPSGLDAAVDAAFRPLPAADR